MSRVLLFVLGVLLLCAAALAALWAAGQVLVALGALLTGAAGVLGRLLLFLVLGAGAGGVSYFVASAWRPSQLVTGQLATGQLVTGQPVTLSPEPPTASASGPRWLRGKRTVVDPAPAATPKAPLAEVPATEPASTQSEENADTTVIITAAPQVSPPPQDAGAPTRSAPGESELPAPDDSAAARPPSV